jgi:hypothetical protein
MYHDDHSSRPPSTTGKVIRVVIGAVGFAMFCCLIVITAITVRNNGKNFPSGSSQPDQRGSNCAPLPNFSTEIFDANKDRPKHTTVAKLIKNGRGFANGTVLENYSVLIDEHGKIKEAGSNIDPKYAAAEVIDAGGKVFINFTN